MIRERQGLSQAKFAELLDRSEGAVQQWETEKLSLSEKSVLHIALVFNVDASWIWEEAGAPPGWGPTQPEANEESATVEDLRDQIADLEKRAAARQSELMTALAQVRKELGGLRTSQQRSGHSQAEGSNQ